MTVAYICFQYSNDTFEELLQKYVNILQTLFNLHFGYVNASIMKISFVDYKNKRFYPSFPLNKHLTVHNTTRIDQFGFGQFAGSFFDTLIQVNTETKINYRVFYSIENNDKIMSLPEISSDTQSNEQPEQSTEEIRESERDETETTQTTNGDKIFILGEERPFIKKGRATYIFYNDKYISLTEARKLEKQMS